MTDTRTLTRTLLTAVATTGGATVGADLSTPREGYAVALHGHESASADATPERVDAYVDAHRALLADPHTYLGAWCHDGALVLDLSTVVPTLAEALAEARATGELAVYDLAHDVEVAA